MLTTSCTQPPEEGERTERQTSCGDIQGSVAPASSYSKPLYHAEDTTTLNEQLSSYMHHHSLNCVVELVMYCSLARYNLVFAATIITQTALQSVHQHSSFLCSLVQSFITCGKQVRLDHYDRHLVERILKRRTDTPSPAEEALQLSSRQRYLPPSLARQATPSFINVSHEKSGRASSSGVLIKLGTRK